jgi:hypothetical protein
MPFHRERYPEDWKAISKRIREERAGNKCEWCDVANKAYGARDRNDEWHDYERIGMMSASAGEYLFGEFPKCITIVLTVAHIDHDTTNNDDSNLAALCQRCHLRHDAKHHAKNAAVTRRRKYAERTGQTSFID